MSQSVEEDVCAETTEAFTWADPRTFFLEPDHWHEPFVLGGDDAHHLLKVLRLRPGDEVRLLNGKGREGAFRIEECAKREVRLSLIREWIHPEPEAGVILAAGWTKAARRSWILEKAVEFGAAGVWFWQAERSQFPVPGEVKESWIGQLVAGAKQCRNPWLPDLRPLPGGVTELVARVDSLERERPETPVRRHALLEDTLGPAPVLPETMLGGKGLTVCVIGPEGGFTPREVAVLREKGFAGFSLGKRVLRWETAALLCLGLHWWGQEAEVGADQA